MATSVDSMPAFVRLAAHPLRWHLLRDLSLGDRAVRELTASAEQPQNLVSYHLRLLRDAGLVSARRSSADGRDHYYSLDLDRCREQLDTAARSLHPALLGNEPATTGTSPARVLFLCTGNSARSQIAEALVAARSGGTVVASSAGSAPRELHPDAIAVMRDRGIDISANRVEHLDAYVDEHFDRVVTLCDRVREVCPQFPGGPAVTHWSIANPADASGTPSEVRSVFERTATEIDTRVRWLLAELAPTQQPGASRDA